MTENIPYSFTKESRAQFISPTGQRRKSQDEKYQKEWLRTYVGIDVGKGTGIRVNSATGELKKLYRVMKEDDFHSWSEDFDGIHKSTKTFYSLKMITCAGGAQNRAIREVAHHISACVNHLRIRDEGFNFHFILDGAQVLKYQKQLLNMIPPQYLHRFYIGSMRAYKDFNDRA
jgi:hypothetical protein